MGTIVTSAAINDAYDVLVAGQQAYQKAAVRAVKARRNYEVEFATALATRSKELGANETIRKANFNKDNPALVTRAVETEDDRDEARFNLKLAEIRVERVRALLRADEVVAQIDRSKA